MQTYVANKKENQSVHFIIKDLDGNIVTETNKSEKAYHEHGRKLYHPSYFINGRNGRYRIYQGTVA